MDSLTVSRPDLNWVKEITLWHDADTSSQMAADGCRDVSSVERSPQVLEEPRRWLPLGPPSQRAAAQAFAL